MSMQLTVHIPDDLAGRLGEASGDLSRRALEAFALEEFRSGNLTQAELRRMLGFSTREMLDGFLKEHGVFTAYSLDDLEQERQALCWLGF
jgi:predicted HTH domain antitoxin